MLALSPYISATACSLMPQSVLISVSDSYVSYLSATTTHSMLSPNLSSKLNSFASACTSSCTPTTGNLLSGPSQHSHLGMLQHTILIRSSTFATLSSRSSPFTEIVAFLTSGYFSTISKYILDQYVLVHTILQSCRAEPRKPDPCRRGARY